MSINVKLSEETVDIARRQAKSFNRTLGGQVDYWVKIARLGELYPELSFHYLLDLMQRDKLEILECREAANPNELSVGLDTRGFKFNRADAND